MTIVQIIKTLFEIALMGAFTFSLLYFAITLFALVHARLRMPISRRYSLKHAPKVTVQIPTYNELAALNCAQRCLQFDYPADNLQIIIGDDSNDPHISEKIDQFAAHNPRIQISRRGGNSGFKPGNLNAMLPQSTGDYLLILDSDFLPKHDFLARLVQPVIDDPELAGVQASWRVLNVRNNLSTLMGSGIVNVVHAILMPFMYEVTRHVIFCGSGELIRKKDLLELGGWTEGALTEDVDYSLRLITAGKRIAYLDDLRIRCEVPYTAYDLFRQQMRWAYGVVRAFMLHFKKLLRSQLIQKRVKCATLIFSSGYIMISLLLLTTIFGTLNLLCGLFGFDPSTAASSTYTIGHFIYDSTLNLILTGGMLLSSLAAGFINGFGFRSLGRLFIAALTIGFICMFFVGRGILTAWLGLPMKWFMLRKAGNERAA
jgi:cellulose synthase/poly-beta-1,6-N-acetylglucosamine synthase-like glycosyltransferase